MMYINVNSVDCNSSTLRDDYINKFLSHNHGIDFFCAKVFFLTTKRSAWHSTTTNRYRRFYPVFLNKKSAKLKAEELRKKGSYFIINEIPSIVIELQSGSIVLIQINTEEPFKHYSIEALGEEYGRRRYGYLASYLHIGVNIFELLQTFRWDSNFWLINQPEQNSILAFHVNADKKEFCLLQEKTPLKFYKSYSNGSEYYLGWNEENSKVNSSFIRQLIAQSKNKKRKN